jgi:hypothetical protein
MRSGPHDGLERCGYSRVLQENIPRIHSIVGLIDLMNVKAVQERDGNWRAVDSKARILNAYLYNRNSQP